MIPVKPQSFSRAGLSIRSRISFLVEGFDTQLALAKIGADESACSQGLRGSPPMYKRPT